MPKDLRIYLPPLLIEDYRQRRLEEGGTRLLSGFPTEPGWVMITHELAIRMLDDAHCRKIFLKGKLQRFRAPYLGLISQLMRQIDPHSFEVLVIELRALVLRWVIK